MSSVPTTSQSRLAGLAGLAVALICAVSTVSNLQAAIINAASVAFPDVSAAVNSALDGDTVLLPAGTASWTQTLYVSKRISIVGATAVAGDHTNQPMAATDLTIIQDNITLIGSNLVGKIIQ